MSSVNFTVFGLGNKTYEKYNTVAKYIDKMMDIRGARRIYELGLGDDDDNLDDDFE